MSIQFLASAHKNIGPVYLEQLNNSPNNNTNTNNLISTMGVSNTRIIHRNLINTPINGHSTRLSPQSVQERFENRMLLTARRSLFGSPEPGEIKNLYNENVQRDRDRFVNRYGFDIFTEKFINDNDITATEKNTPRITEGQDTSSNTNCNNNNINNDSSNVKSLENNLLNSEDRLHEQNNDEKNNFKLNINKKININLIENSNCNKIINNIKCDEYNHIINNNNNKNNNECNIKNSNKKQQSISTTATPTITPLKDKKSSLISCERSTPYRILTKQSRLSDFYSSRKKILTSDTPKPQKAKLLDENIINELQQNNHEKLEGGQKY